MISVTSLESRNHIAILVSRLFSPFSNISKIAAAKKISRELPLHPVHLTPDKEGNLPPSALVPFCSYQGEKDFLGKQLPGVDNMTFCDKFQPTILEGQVCYTLDIARFRKFTTKAGKSNGLFLLLDPYPYHLGKTQSNADGGPKNEDQSFKVFIHTLAQYTSFGPGSYVMSSLKKMTGTTGFKQLPVKQRECFVHSREECQTTQFLGKVQNECKCIPWALQTDQVIRRKKAK